MGIITCLDFRYHFFGVLLIALQDPYEQSGESLPESTVIVREDWNVSQPVDKCNRFDHALRSISKVEGDHRLNWNATCT